MGRRNRPFYRINAVEKRNQRDGRVLENLGWYDPESRDETKQVVLKEERIKFWLSQGAQPSDTVNDILARAAIIDAEAWSAVRRRRNQKNYEAGLKAKVENEAKAKADAEAKAKAAAEAEAKAKADAEAKAKAEAEAAAAAETATSEEAPAEGASES
jgi:small subunit ribosomal protein S16